MRIKDTNLLAPVLAQQVRTGLVLALVAVFCFPLSHVNAADCSISAPGCLDPGFGTMGKVTTNTDGIVPSSTDVDQARAVVIQPFDGKIVAAGITANPANTGDQDFAVVRYNTDGSLDATFGSGGIVKTPFSTAIDHAYAVALQSKGYIVVAGYTTDPSTRVTSFAIARYDTLGNLDPGFGSGGKTTITFNVKPAGGSSAHAVAIQTDGKIVLSGIAGNYFALARLNGDGSLDTTFGAGGKVTNSFGISWAVLILGDSKILASGQTNGAGKRGIDFTLSRYMADGSLDATFGNGGVVTTDFFGYADRVRGIAIDANGNIVAAGDAGKSLSFASRDFAVARYTANGQLDTTFGSGGKRTTDILGNWDQGYTVAIQPDGKIIEAGFGYSSDGTVGSFALVRYNTNGNLDTFFGSAGTGIVTTVFAGGNNNFAYGMALQPDGKIVAGGTADTSVPANGFNFALARYFQ